MKRLAALVCFLSACGGATPDPASPKAPAAPCNSDLVTNAEGAVPPGWTLRGHATMRSEDGHIARIDIADANGKQVGTHPVTEAQRDKMYLVIRGAVCDVNGMVVVPNALAPKPADVDAQGMTADIYATSKEDPAADATQMCDATDPPRDPPIGDIELGARRGAWLTTAEWRAAVVLVSDRMVHAYETGSKAGMRAEAGKCASELDALARKYEKTRCWYAEVLKRYAESEPN